MAIALFIGRFQPFHNGHLEIIKKILSENKKIKIGIGSTQENNTLRNPFSAEERKTMIKECMKDAEISDFEIFDIPDIFNNDKWVAHVENIVNEFDTVYAGSKLTKKLFEKAGYDVIDVERLYGLSASEIRLKIKSGVNWEDLVPEAVADIIEEIDGVERLKKIKKKGSDVKESCKTCDDERIDKESQEEEE